MINGGSMFQGITGYRQLSDPRPEWSYSRTNVDELHDSWFSDTNPNPALIEGAVHPLYPGLILMEADYEEVSPFWPATPEQPDGVKGEWKVSCRWAGDAKGGRLTKFIGRSAARQIAVGFDEFTERYATWNALPMAVTGTASTNTISHAGNYFSDGMAIAFMELTGSALTGLSTTTLPTVYYVKNRTADGYQLSTTLGGSTVSLSTNLTAGYVAEAKFVVGTAHPTWSGMLVASVSFNDDVTTWTKADVQYVGKMTGKPMHRMITCNGQSMSSSAPIAWSFTDGWSTAENSNVQLPEIGVEDTQLAIGTINSNLVPSSQGEVGTPSSAPSVRSVFIFGTDDTIVYNWPNGWSILGVSDVQTLNLQSNVRIAKTMWRYCWPFSLK